MTPHQQPGLRAKLEARIDGRWTPLYGLTGVTPGQVLTVDNADGPDLRVVPAELNITVRRGVRSISYPTTPTTVAFLAGVRP